jgi:hypothetical protein
MKKIVTIIITMLAVNTIVNAQAWIADSVNLGANQVNEVYYSLTNGTVKSEPTSSWFMALQMNNQTAGIWANHSRGIRVLNIHKPASTFTTLTLADTANKTEQLNGNKIWDRGALNVNRNPTDTFDYGWGKYDQASHNVYGDSVFIINQNANYYSVVIDSLVGDSMKYCLRIGVFTPQGYLTFPYVYRKGTKYQNANFMHIRNTQQGLIDTLREPKNTDWEILFHKYIDLVSIGGPAVPYPVGGGFTSYGTMSTRVVNVALDQVPPFYFNYPLSPIISSIGSDWKNWDGTQYLFPDSISMIVKSKQNELWQIKFTGYSSTTGDIKFNKRKIATFATSIETKVNENDITISPNPTSNNALLTVQASASGQAQLHIISSTGTIINSASITVAQGLNAYNIPTAQLASGLYTISITGSNIKASKQLIKQ